MVKELLDEEALDLTRCGGTRPLCRSRQMSEAWYFVPVTIAPHYIRCWSAVSKTY
jgi:hypothetical protein